jgi:hypothetical protein
MNTDPTASPVVYPSGPAVAAADAPGETAAADGTAADGTATATLPRQSAPGDPPSTALLTVPAPDLAPQATPDLAPDAGPGAGARRPGIPARARARGLAVAAAARRWAATSRLAGWLGRHGGTILVVAGVLAGAVLRFTTPSHLWLDESLTVEIARRPVGGLLAALRHDGSPPLYYLLLHVWIKVFGDGDVAVRALSGVLSLATLPLAWLAGIRAGQAAIRHGNGDESTPRRVARATLLLFASSPYAIRYGSETRMYSMVVLLVLVFGLLLVRALEESSVRRLGLLTLATAALVYTHYWTFLLIFTVAAFLLLQSRRRPAFRRRTLRAFAAMAASAVLFAPWMPSFLFQMLHTGTPWAPRVQAQVLLDTVFDWAGPQSTGALLALILLGAALLGLTGRPAGRELAVKVSGRVPGRYLAAVWLLPLTLAWVVNMFGGSAYTERYTGISLPAFLMLAALGLAVMPSRRWRAGLLAVAVVAGLLGGWQLDRVERTQAGQIAGAINANARPGDVVAFCPDQLGPAVHRALTRLGVTDLKEVAYADSTGPALVDWVDYAARMQHANANDFARQLNEMAGPDHAIFLVRADGYKFLESSCGLISEQLAVSRDRTGLVNRGPQLEGASLERFSTLR